MLRVLGMFSFDGDLEWAHGIPDRPVFDWFLAVPFYIGVVLWVLRLLGKGRPSRTPIAIRWRCSPSGLRSCWPLPC